jgi:6-phosphofructokinase 2
MIVTVTLNPSLDEWMSLTTLRVGELNRASRFARYPGGKGINVSRVIRELGGRTTALALTGGEDGAILKALMSRLSIPLQGVEVAGSTRNNYQISTTSPRALTEINTEGPRVSPSVLQALERRLLEHRPSLRCVVLSGSLPPGIPATIYGRWIRLLARRGTPCVLDASGPALRWGLRAHPWLVKPNRQEAEELLQVKIAGMREAIAATRRLVRLGSSLVILSLGKDGALLALHPGTGGQGTGDRKALEMWKARPPAVKTVSAVGAGDSLVGGFVTAWTQGRTALEAFRLGVACGAATAMTPGTELCHRADVRRLLGRVIMRRV